VCFLCSKPSSYVCEVCGLVEFCSKDHERVHRPENFCFPFKVELKPDIGRTLVATRDIEPLELIMWDSPAALGPRMGGLPVCLECLKPAKNDSFCSKCGWPVCNKECEEGNAHRNECEILSKTKEKIDFSDVTKVCEAYRLITPFRLLMVKRRNPEVWERLSYLMDHNKERQQDKELWNTYQIYVNRYLQTCDTDFTSEEIDRVSGLLWTNSFSCARGEGQAIFPTFSFASHSCIPNCASSVFPNKTLALQAKKKIQTGEELTISYISTLQGLLKRKMKLREKWFFECCCLRCSDPTELGSQASSLLCQVCNQADSLVTSKDVTDSKALWCCNKCVAYLSADEVHNIENRFALKMQQIEHSNKEEFEEMLKYAGKELHENHFLMVLLKRHLIGLYCLTLEDLNIPTLEKVKGYCESIEKVYNTIDPGYHKDRGTILRALSEVSKILAKKYLAEGRETEEDFKKRVELCVKIFQESQNCMFVRLKKEPKKI